MEKTYVEVQAEFLKDGSMYPVSLLWKDKKIGIDKITNITPFDLTFRNQTGNRYTCISNGGEFLLYFDCRRWYVDF